MIAIGIKVVSGFGDVGIVVGVGVLALLVGVFGGGGLVATGVVAAVGAIVVLLLLVMLLLLVLLLLMFRPRCWSWCCCVPDVCCLTQNLKMGVCLNCAGGPPRTRPERHAASSKRHMARSTQRAACSARNAARRTQHAALTQRRARSMRHAQMAVGTHHARRAWHAACGTRQ